MDPKKLTLQNLHHPPMEVHPARPLPLGPGPVESRRVKLFLDTLETPSHPPSQQHQVGEHRSVIERVDDQRIEHGGDVFCDAVGGGGEGGGLGDVVPWRGSMSEEELGGERGCLQARAAAWVSGCSVVLRWILEGGVGEWGHIVGLLSLTGDGVERWEIQRVGEL